jgi:hypothetical protein
MTHSCVCGGEAIADPGAALALTAPVHPTHARSLRFVIGLLLTLGSFIIFGLSPSVAKDYSNTYDVDVAIGSNSAHAGQWVVKVSYDSTNQTVSFTVQTPPVATNQAGRPIIDGKTKKPVPKEGQASWNNWTWTVPARVSGNTVTFGGKSGIPTKPEGQKGFTPKAADELTFTGATLDTSTGTLKIGSIDNVGADYPITTIGKATPQGANGKAAKSSVPPGKSLNFDSLTGTLSITGSTVVDLPNSGDPLLGADVTYPDFSLTGFNAAAGVYTFVNQNPAAKFIMSNATTTFQTSTLSSLDYSVSQNLFYGFLTDNNFDATASPFIDSVASALDFNGPLYDPLALYDVEIMPDVNFLTLTQDFNSSGDTGATDLHYISDPPVPEPSVLLLISAGMIGIAVLRFHSEARRPCRPAPAGRA